MQVYSRGRRRADFKVAVTKQDLRAERVKKKLYPHFSKYINHLTIYLFI